MIQLLAGVSEHRVGGILWAQLQLVMADLADKRGINCSQVLQEGLRSLLDAG